MKIVIPGNPIPKSRPRIYQKKGKSCAYDPDYRAKAEIKLLMENILRNKIHSKDKEISKEAFKIFYGEEFKLWVTFYMPIPKSFSKSKKKAMALNLIPHTKKPDLSNMLKFYEDCANGILFHDDSMITSCGMMKLYSDNPRTEITLIALPKKDPIC